MSMKTCAIIAEYNPIHKGHIYQIQKAKEVSKCECLVVILSSYFSQRGLPSILSIEDKTKLALEYGVNLVLELPVCYTCQSADYFAKYAIESLNELHIDTLCFGSETNDIEKLNTYLNQMESIKKDETVSMNQNINLDIQPNDILAIQYIKYCKKYNIEPIPIQRNNNYKSATQTRNDFFEGLSQFQDSYFQKNQNWNTYYPYLRKFLILTSNEQLSTYFLVNEGIESRLKENAKKFKSWSDFLEHSISKTYTRARIQRTCVCILLQITKNEMKENDSFHTSIVLGFDSIGQRLLKECKESHIISKFNELNDFLQQLEIKSQYIYFNEYHSRKVLPYDR